jgi:hypothetical protein
MAVQEGLYKSIFGWLTTACPLFKRRDGLTIYFHVGLGMVLLGAWDQVYAATTSCSILVLSIKFKLICALF